MIRQEQCDKVCRILDDVLANRPTERDSLIVATRKAFDALEQSDTNCLEIPNNSDTISRRQAIEALKEKVFHNLSDEFYGAMQVLDELPSVQPERPKEKWIHQAKFSRIECDQCGKVFRNSFAPKNFCPNCGADMRGERE